MLQEIKNRILAGGEITPDEAIDLALHADRAELYAAADEIRRKFCNRTLDSCSIINARSGHCPENCKWCAQSAHYNTHIETYDAIPEEEAMTMARLHESQGIKRLSLVTSGRSVRGTDLDYFCNLYRRMGRETHLQLCASMGLLKREELQKLKEAGVKRYHCNLETASSYFPELCTTHTSEQKKETIRAAQEVGLEICSGGIIGMGETLQQRIELAFELKELGVCSVPVNILSRAAPRLHPLCRWPGPPLARHSETGPAGRTQRSAHGRHAHHSGVGRQRRQSPHRGSRIRPAVTRTEATTPLPYR